MKLEDAVIARIEELKGIHGYTQYRLSEESGVPQTTLISIKRKRSKDVGISNIWKISSGFGITVIDFFSSPLFENIEQDIIKNISEIK